MLKIEKCPYFGGISRFYRIRSLNMKRSTLRRKLYICMAQRSQIKVATVISGKVIFCCFSLICLVNLIAWWAETRNKPRYNQATRMRIFQPSTQPLPPYDDKSNHRQQICSPYCEEICYSPSSPWRLLDNEYCCFQMICHLLSWRNMNPAQLHSAKGKDIACITVIKVGITFNRVA